MEARDCSWCGSARSIEHGVCQVCLMRFPDLEAQSEGVVVVLEDREPELPGEEEATGTAVLD